MPRVKQTITGAVAVATAALLLTSLLTTSATTADAQPAQGPAEATPALRADYRFKGSLSSSVAGAPALRNVGPGANTFATEDVNGRQRTVLQFPENNGLDLRNATSVIPRDRYTIAIRMRFDFTSNYQRIVNYVPEVNADEGFYGLNGTVTLYPVTIGNLPLITPDAWTDLVLTRSRGGRLRAYIDGTQVFDVSVGENSAGRIGPRNILRFFRDSAIGLGFTSGAVARIRLFDQAMTPTQVAALNS